MSLWAYESRLFLRSRIAVFALLLLALLASASVAFGIAETARQRAEIAAIPAAQAEDIGAIAEWIDGGQKDAGSAAYYSFHPTWDAPSPLAFAALGMRDVSPYILRVRALGLEAQIYDGDIFNPELALPGRFDFAFVLIFLAPLFVIVLLHDIISSEREAGRLRTLEALPGGARRLWGRRIALRLGFLFAALGLPLAVAAIIEGVAGGSILLVLAIASAYCLFWTIVTLLVSRFRWSSVANAATLAAVWILLVLVLPTLGHVAINRAVPLEQGSEIALAQREAVNRAWDIPREETMRRFYAGHPEWANSPPLTDAFHYKWYFAFHQVGDESVAEKVRTYRGGLERRATWADRLAWVLPSVGVQTLLTRIARTDVAAQLAYQDRIRDYHADLRAFYYGYLFRDIPFAKADFDRAPRFSKPTL